MQDEKSVFDTLFDINVNNHVEKKNGLTYLSWAYAWAEVKKRYPLACYKVYETESGCIYHTDGKTCWVKTGVTIDAQEHIEYLPVMDYRNKSISLESITSFDVNKTIQRSLTKALARHGLGLYIYAGEDLPEGEIEKISDLNVKVLEKTIQGLKEPEKILEDILKANNVKNLKDLNVKQHAAVALKLKELYKNPKLIKDGQAEPSKPNPIKCEVCGKNIIGSHSSPPKEIASKTKKEMGKVACIKCAQKWALQQKQATVSLRI